MEFYWVAFRYTAKAGGYQGVVTASPYDSKTAFDKFCASAEGKECLTVQEIVEHGITRERAIELAKSTPRECRMAAAFEEAERNPRNPLALDWALQKAAIAIDESQK